MPELPAPGLVQQLQAVMRAHVEIVNNHSAPVEIKGIMVTVSKARPQLHAGGAMYRSLLSHDDNIIHYRVVWDLGLVM